MIIYGQEIGVFNIISIAVPIAALVMAVYIPGRIMINQIYADLLKEYRSPELGEAITALIDFYKDVCHKDVTQITKKYEARYRKEKADIKNSLHFKRRLLWQYYWQIATLRYEYRWGRFLKKTIEKNFTKRESHVLRLLYHTIDGAKKCSRDIGNVPEPKESEGKTEKLVCRLYRESKGWE
jgi:hypothetical protein